MPDANAPQGYEPTAESRLPELSIGTRVGGPVPPASAVTPRWAEVVERALATLTEQP